MGIFYVLDEATTGPDPSGILNVEFSRRLQRIEDRPNIFAELCVLDILLAINQIRDSYYKERLILKGGHSVRTYVPLRAHRFSYDVDFNIDRDSGHTFREIQTLKDDLNKFAQTRRSEIRPSITLNNQRFHWITLNYQELIEREYGVRIPEEPKIEICKDCRTIRTPAENEMVTMVNPKLLAIALPHVKQLDLNEQLSNKLYVIGVTARRRRHFDVFDCNRIVEFNASKLDWGIIRESFHAMLRHEKLQSHIRRARELIHKTAEDTNTIRRIESATFEPFNFTEAVKTVSDLYSNLA
jgi:predicted nucleotidyltransferase component of viral defense system